MAGKSVLECRGLRRRFGEIVAVDGVGFGIGAGETYGLLGPNGAGKTTTISMIAGLLERDGGEVTVDGEPMTTRSVRAKSAIGYVPQDLAIYPDLSGRENLMFFARLYGMPTARGEAAHRRGADPDRAGRPGRRPGQALFRRDEAAAEHRHRPAAPAEAADPGRAHGRGRPAEQERDPGQRCGPVRSGDGGPVHHPLHGRGRTAVRPDRHHRPRQADRRGHPRRPRPHGRRGRSGPALRGRRPGPGRRRPGGAIMGPAGPRARRRHRPGGGERAAANCPPSCPMWRPEAWPSGRWKSPSRTSRRSSCT